LENSAEGDNLVTMLAGKVPTTRTVNTKALSSNIVLSGADLLVGGSTSANKDALISVAFKTLEDAIGGKVPTTRKVNNKALTWDVVLDADDIEYNGSTSVYDAIYRHSTNLTKLLNNKTRVWASATEPEINQAGDYDLPHDRDVWIELV